MDNIYLHGDYVTPKFSTYQVDGRLALVLEDEAGWTHSVVTVNIPDETLSNELCGFIDTNNCGDEILSWLELNKFGKLTGRNGLSGYCIYPEFQFTKEIVDKYKVQTIEEMFATKEV